MIILVSTNSILVLEDFRPFLTDQVYINALTNLEKKYKLILILILK